MRASTIPIDDLRRKYQADPGSLTVDEFEAIAKYKKLVGAGQSPASKPPAVKKKPGRKAKPKSLEERIYIQRQRDLDSIDAKLDANIPLTASDRKMQADMLEALASQKSKEETAALVRRAIERGLGPEKVSSIHELIRLRDSSPRDDVRMNCAKEIIKLHAMEAAPDDEFEVEPFDPSEPARVRTLVTDLPKAARAKAGNA